MRRLLGSLLVVTVLIAGCGSGNDSDSDSGNDAGEDSGDDLSAKPSLPDGESGQGWQLVEIVHATAVDGRVSTTPEPVGDPAAVADFSAQFTRPAMQEAIVEVVGGHEPTGGSELVAAVVAIGCDVPPGVTYLDGEVRPLKVIDPLQECFAPVTSVAILEVAP